MKRTVVLGSKEFQFELNETAQVWMGEVELNNVHIPIEINLQDFPGKEINWVHFFDFIAFFKQPLMDSLINKSKPLLLKFVEVVGWFGDIKKYRFELEAIVFKEKKESKLFDVIKINYRYALLFKMYHENYPDWEDPYGNYYIDIQDALITGCRREQV